LPFCSQAHSSSFAAHPTYADPRNDSRAILRLSLWSHRRMRAHWKEGRQTSASGSWPRRLEVLDADRSPPSGGRAIWLQPRGGAEGDCRQGLQPLHRLTKVAWSSACKRCLRHAVQCLKCLPTSSNARRHTARDCYLWLLCLGTQVFALRSGCFSSLAERLNGDVL